MTLPAYPFEQNNGTPDLNEIGALLSSQPLQRALSEAAWAARVILRCDASLVFILQPDREKLSAAAWNGREAGDACLTTASRSIQALWASRRSLRWENLAQCEDLEMAALLDGMGLVSGLLLPLRVSSEYAGAWLAAASEPRTFDETDEHILQTLADNIGLTIGSMLLSNENLRFRRETDALYEVSREISQLLNLDRVLEMVVTKTRSLLNAELSYLALVDDDLRVVRVRVTDGARDSALGRMVLPYGEGVGGTVAATRQPMLVDDYPSDPRPKPPGIAEIASTEDIRSIISVPMFTRTQLVGVLFAASRQVAAFNASQVSLLAALGTHAASAIENAHLYEKEKATAEKLLAATSTSEKLLQLVLGNQGLQAIAATLSGLVRSPVLVEDRGHRPLCSSSAGAIGPGGQPLNLTFSCEDIWHDPQFSERLGILQQARHAIHIPPRPERKIYQPRTIAPVVAGLNLLGYVSVLELDTLTEQQYSAIDQASIVLALEFLKLEAAQEVEMRLAGDLLDDLIFGRAGSDPAVLQRAARFNIDLRQPHRILVLDIDQFAQAVRRHRWTDLEALAVKKRFLSTVSSAVQQEFSNALTGTRSDSVLVLMPVQTGSRGQVVDRARRLQQALRESLPELSISVGIGRAAGQPFELIQSYEQAMLALRAISQFGGQGQVVDYESLGVVPLLLQSQNQQELLAFKEQHLGLLLRYDATNHTRLVETLERFLAHNGNLRLTAADCHVHLNSLKYRLQRIQELSGLDLRDGETRFQVQLALAIHRTAQLVNP